MNTRSSIVTRRLALAGLALFGSAGCARAATGGPYEGVWTGLLPLGPSNLRLRLVVGADGSVSVISPDQSPNPMPGEVSSLTAEKLAVHFPTLKARLTGALKDGQINAVFEQGSRTPVSLTRGEAAATPRLTAPGLAALLDQSGAPALGAIASRRGGRATQWQTGRRARLLSKNAVEAGDLWHLGSNTKSMTATLAAILVEKGLIRWDDKVGEILAAVAPQMRDAYRDATFRHLLSHRAGLHGDIPEQAKYPHVSNDARADRSTYAAAALALEPKGEKEATFHYSNAGYVVAAAMMEAARGRPWEVLIRDHLFAPLGIKSAGFGPPGTPKAYDQPQGHRLRIPFSPEIKGADNPVVIGPAGRVHMSLADLALYLAAHRDRAGILKAQSWDVLHTPPFGGDYAMGWVVKPDGGRWHNGSNTFWYAAMEFNSARGTCAAAVCNEASGDGAVHAVLARALASLET